MKKTISMFLAVCILAGTMMNGTAAQAAVSENVLFFESFDGDSELDNSIWEYANNVRVENGELLIANGNYPLLRLPNMNGKKSYELSYRVKFEQAGGAWKAYNEKGGAYVGFGSAVPGMGFSWIRNEPRDGIMNSAADINKWYTIKIEFCTDSFNRYTKWTLLDELGKIADVQARAELYNGTDGTVIPGSAEVTVEKIYFWNDGNKGNIHVDDIMLKEVTPNELIIENFAAAYRDTKLWVNNEHGVTEDGVMTINAGEYPYFKLPNSLDTEKAYRVSYKIKGTTASASSNVHELYKAYSDVGGANFIGYRPGKGFTCEGNEWKEPFVVDGAEYEKLNEWYLVEVEFCQSKKNGYSKWTIRDAEGNELFSKMEEGGLKKYTDGEGFIDQNLAGTNICLWNNMADAPVVVDDITVSLVPTERNYDLLLEETFDAENLDKLKENGNGWHGEGGGTVTVADGTLQLNKGAWIYFDVPNKTNQAAYKVSYDIKVTGESVSESEGILPNTSLVANTAPDYLLGVYNPLRGLSAHKLDFDPKHTIPVSQANDKWYTVTVEFSENEDNSFEKCTLTDTATGEVVGKYSHPYLESGSSSEKVTSNATSYYFWNRGGEGAVAYIDNVKFERISSLRFDSETDITATDYFGNQVKVTDGITTAAAKFDMQFTAAVTQESAAAGITLKEKNNGALVPAQVLADGRTAALVLEQLLKANTTYILGIADTVKSESGDVLDGAVTIEFTTAAAENVKAAIDTLPAANIGELTPGATISVGGVIVNPTADTKTATMVAVFYADGVLTDMQSDKTWSAAAGKAQRMDFKIKVPNDMSRIDKMKIFLWSNLSEMVPYGKYRELLPAE